MNRRSWSVSLVACAAVIAGILTVVNLDRIRARWLASDSPEAAVTDTRLHTCGMHPQVLQEGPGNCPICGMALTPIDSAPPPHEAHSPAGVQVSKQFLQNFAVRTAPVVRADLSAQIRTVGYLEQDESRLVAVTTKLGGWIEASRVSTVGERVSKDDVLFEIYSPELVTAQEEYLAAIRFESRLRAEGAHADAVQRARALLDAAGQRLRRWDLAEGQVEKLKSAASARRTTEVHSPASGLVVEKLADSLEGVRVGPGATVLKIADQSTLWARVEFYEHHLRDLQPGLRAEISLDAFPGRRWIGSLRLFAPAVNPQTQTLTGYVEVENPDGRLRPKMYASVDIRRPGASNALVVPAQSVLRSGNGRDVVIVDAGEGLFVPREVQLGIESDTRVQVLKGLSEGERIVTSSQFLLDSESNLQAGIDRLGGDGSGGHAH